MRESKYVQVRIIAERDPDEFQRRVNEAEIQHAGARPKTTFEISGDMYKCLIEYEHVEHIPETADDVAYLKGIRYTCQSCPNFQPALNKDGSIKKTQKRGTCTVAGTAFRDSGACEFFYSELLQERLQPVDEEEVE